MSCNVLVFVQILRKMGAMSDQDQMKKVMSYLIGHRLGSQMLPQMLPGLTADDLVGDALAKGMKGEDVKAVQVRLAALGYYDGKLDGSFGAGTRDAVKLFQARNGMKVDGKVGPRTLAKLNATSAIPAWGTGTVLPEGDG